MRAASRRDGSTSAQGMMQSFRFSWRTRARETRSMSTELISPAERTSPGAGSGGVWVSVSVTADIPGVDLLLDGGIVGRTFRKASNNPEQAFSWERAICA